MYRISDNVLYNLYVCKFMLVCDKLPRLERLHKGPFQIIYIETTDNITLCIGDNKIFY